jgi:hypothetical protein
MTIPATPINEAAERYSPEIAEAFHPTETARPATKKSEAVLDLRADQNPIQTVATTVIKEKQRIQGSICLSTFRMPEALSASKAIIPDLAPVQSPVFPGPSTDE